MTIIFFCGPIKAHRWDVILSNCSYQLHA